MNRRRAALLSAMVLSSTILAGCGPGTGPTGAPASSPPPSVAPTSPSTPAPTTVPTATPATSPAASGCPSTLPTRLSSIAELADRACYGATELTIDGWLAPGPVFVDHNESVPSWTIPIAALYEASPTVREFVFDFLLLERVQGIDVVANPTSGLDVSGRGRWVTLRGHFNDPEAMTCTLTVVNSYPGEYAGPDCDRLFVVTAVTPLERPAPACPTDSPLSMAVFLATDASCFMEHAVRVAGWEDVGEGFGGTAPIYPIALDPSLRFPDAQLVRTRWESTGEKDPIFPWVVEGSGVRFNRSDTEVVVTGLFGHHAAEGCRPDPTFGWTWSPPVSWAQQRCEHLFVITGVKITG